MSLSPIRLVDESDQLDEVSAAAEHQQHFARVYLPQLYANAPTMTHLILTDSCCRDVSVTALADALRVNTSLLVLKLEDNGITDDGLAKVAEVVAHNRSLVHIHLDGNNFTDEGVLALAKAAETNFTVTRLSVSRNKRPLSDAARSAVSTIVKLNERPPALKQLVLRVERGERPTSVDLSFYGDAPADFEERQLKLLDDFCARVLADVLRKCPAMHQLLLANNMISDDGAAALAAAISEHELLDKLDLGGNAVTDIGCRALSNALTSNNSVTQLNLLGCLAGPAAVMDLQLALLVNTQPPRLKMFLPRLRNDDDSLFHLELDDHESLRFYGDVAVSVVLTALQAGGNRHLISLGMPHGQIGARGVVAFSRFLKGVPLHTRVGAEHPLCYLQTLDLSHNPGLGEHCHQIAKALEDNTSLLSLNLSASEVTDASAFAFASMLEHNDTLTQLDLSYNPLICDAGAHFAYAFNVNHVLTDFSLESTGVSRKVLAAIEEHRQAVGEPEELQLILPAVFDSSDAITEIHLNGLTDMKSGRLLGESSARLLAQPLQNNFVVTVVDISHNEINFDGASALLTALLSNRVTLKSLNMSHNPIGHGSVLGRMVASVIAAHTALREFDVTSTGLTTEGARAIVSELDVPRRNSVRVLRYGGEDAIDLRVRQHIDLLVAANSHDNCLKTRLRALLRNWQQDAARGIDTVAVDLSGFAVSERNDDVPTAEVDAMMAVLYDFLVLVPTIERLDLRRNGLGDEGAAHIARWMASAPACTVVLLDNNKMGTDGVEALAQAVRSNYLLRKVSVNDNPALDATPEAQLAQVELQSMLHYNEQPEDIKNLLVAVGNDTLHAIDESGRAMNHLDDAHVRLIVKELRTNTTLCSINLSNNYISSDGFRLLLSVLPSHPSIEHVVLRNTLVTGDQKLGDEVAAVIARSSTLRTVDLSYCDFANSFIPPILRALETNQSVRCIGLAEAGIASHLEKAVTTRVNLNSEQRLKALAARMRDNDPAFTAFDVADSGFAPDQIVEVAQALGETRHVVSVNVAGNLITEGRLVNGLVHNQSVTDVDLSRNRFGSDLVMPLCRVIRSHTHLRRVDLRENSFLKADMLQPLRHVVWDTESVVEVRAGDPHEQDAILTDREHPLHFLTHFAINHTPSVKTVLSRIRRDDPSVTTIDATGDADVTDVAIELFVDACGANSHVRKLVLAKGHVTDRGVELLTDLIVARRQLTHLDLSHNCITDRGAGAIAGVLLVSDALRFLNLRANPDISSKGVAAIARATSVNQKILRCIVSDEDARADRLLEPYDSPVKLRAEKAQKARNERREERRRLLMCGDDDGESASTDPEVRQLQLAALPADDPRVVAAQRQGVEGSGDDDDSDGEDAPDFVPIKLASSVFLNTRAPQLKTFLMHEEPASIVELDLSNLAGRPLSDFIPDVDASIAATPSFDDAACIVLCTALKKNRTLTMLNLSNNGLSHDAAFAVAQMIRENVALRVVDVSSNSFSTSTSSVVSAVAANDSLLHVDISGNGAPVFVTERLQVLLAVNQEPMSMKKAIVGLLEEKLEPRELAVSCPKKPSRVSAMEGRHSRGDPDAEPLAGDWDDMDATTKYYCTKLARHAHAHNWASVRKPQLDDASISILVDALSTNLSVRHLTLSRNAITDTGVKRVANFLADGRSSIMVLDLSHNLVTSTGANEIARVASTLPTLSEVILSHNQIDIETVSNANDALLANGNVVRFDLHNTRISDAELVVTERLLQVNRLTVGDVRSCLTAAFRDDPAVTSIDLNGMLSRGMWRPELLDICHGLQAHARNVRSLTIEFNDLGDAAVATLAPAIAQWRSLESVSLGANLIVDITPLCEALVAPTCGLKLLDLRQNRLNVKSARALSDALRENDSVTSLDVSGNQWGHVGVALLLGALPMNDSLVDVDVSGRDVTDDQIAKVQNALGLHYKKIKLPDDESSPQLSPQKSALQLTASGSAVNAARRPRQRRASFLGEDGKPIGLAGMDAPSSPNQDFELRVETSSGFLAV